MTDTPTPPAMTPEQRAVLVAELKRRGGHSGYAEQLEADGVTIATLTAERDGLIDLAEDLSGGLFDANKERDALQASLTATLQREAATYERHDAKMDAAQAEIARLTADLATAREDDGNPRPIETAPKDGTMLRLLVDYEGVENWMPLTDDNQSWTIGFNDLQNIGEDEWVFVGWNWSQDCFGTGEGKVIGWLPFASIRKGAAT